jgi:hypothetical protein
VGKITDNATTVTTGKGYQSIKSTEIYTPDTAPINYQDISTKEIPDNKEKIDIERVVLEPDKPVKEVHIEQSFLESLSQVYISGQYYKRGHVSLRIKEIIALLIQNKGMYHVVVNPSLRGILTDIIEFGKDALLGRAVTQRERKAIISQFKHDNV